MPTEAQITLCRLETIDHIGQVRTYLNQAIIDLVDRSVNHDASKLEEPELSSFSKITPFMKHIKYGSIEYKEVLNKIGPAISHHYEHNDHHPENNPNGIKGMTLMSLLEMTCDWIAASLRNSGGDIWDSLEINKERFSISDDLFAIIENTIKYIQREVELDQ
jgi:hypothetical protein